MREQHIEQSAKERARICKYTCHNGGSAAAQVFPKLGRRVSERMASTARSELFLKILLQSVQLAKIVTRTIFNIKISRYTVLGPGHSLAGQPLATPTTGRGESGQVPIIISCLTCQEFLGMLSGFNSVRLPFSTLVRELTSCASMLYYYTHAQLIMFAPT